MSERGLWRLPAAALVIAISCVAPISAVVACSSDDGGGTAPGRGGTSAGGQGGASAAGGTGGTGGIANIGGTGGVSCPGTQKTTVSGKVYAPTAIAPDPIPNVAVYVPSGPLQPFTPGVACVRCGEETTSLARTVSKSDGSFVLENVPPGNDVTIVLQAGRWRREIKGVNVAACTDTALSPDQTKLPRNQSEGDIPKMALQTGYVDGLECLLTKILDPAEITDPGGNGRVHLYKGSGADSNPALPPSSDLWSHPDRLDDYDVVFFPCDFTDDTTTPELPAAGVVNLTQYVDVGGRLFLTHGGGKWLKETSPQPYPGLVQFNIQPDPTSPLPSLVDVSFPKGQIFAEWLVNVGISTTLGELDVDSAQWYVDSVSAPAQRWIHSTSPVTVQHFTFNTPISAIEKDQCGRVLFSNFHVKAPPSSATYPTHCTDLDQPLETNEKIIEFMLFDTTGCVQPDKEPVK